MMDPEYFKSKSLLILEKALQILKVVGRIIQLVSFSHTLLIYLPKSL